MDSEAFLQTIGKRIRNFRKSKKISQEKLAELSGLHPTYISDVERGKVNASITTYYSISIALDVPFADVITIGTATDKDFEELVVLSALIRGFDKEKKDIILLALRGMVEAIKKI